MTGNETNPWGKPGEEGRRHQIPMLSAEVPYSLSFSGPSIQPGSREPAPHWCLWMSRDRSPRRWPGWLPSSAQLAAQRKAALPAGTLGVCRLFALISSSLPIPAPPSTVWSREHTPEPESSSSSLSKPSLWEPGIIKDCRAAQGKYQLTPDG